MKAWLARLFSTPPVPVAQERAVSRAAAAPAPPVAAAAPRASVRPEPSQPIDFPHGIEVAFLAWLIDGPGTVQAPPGARESRALQRLDRLAADTSAHAILLPRAAAVVPQLLARLRDAESSTGQLVEYVSRDVTLVAEVMRVANSAYYRRDTAIVELGHAVRLLGVVGLKSAIARSVLRPMFNARGGELVTRSAGRLWEHTEFKTQLCTALARSEGHDPFEGYMAGLVHNAVWSAVLRTMDGIVSEEPWGLSAALVSALGLRRDRLFEAVAKQWQLSEGLVQVACEVSQRGLALATSPQARMLCAGDRLAALLCLPEHVEQAQAWIDSLGEPVRNCFDALRHAPGVTPA